MVFRLHWMQEDAGGFAEREERGGEELADNAEHQIIVALTYPVSWLHQRTRGAPVRPARRPGRRPGAGTRRPGGELSHDLLEGAGRVRITDQDWDFVGGNLPDLILYNGEERQVRIIEVVETGRPGMRHHIRSTARGLLPTGCGSF